MSNKKLDVYSMNWIDFLDHVTYALRKESLDYEELKKDIQRYAEDHKENRSMIEEAVGLLKEIKVKVDEVCVACLGPRWDHDKPFAHSELCRACIAEAVHKDCYEEAFDNIEKLLLGNKIDYDKLKEIDFWVKHAREESKHFD